MVGVIEHGNTGAAAGFAAFGQGMGGIASGMQLGQQLAERKAELAAKKQQIQAFQDAKDLDDQYREAQEAWDSLRAGMGPDGGGLPESVLDFPSLGPGQSEIPGVQVPGAQLTPEEAEIFPSLSPEARREVLEEKRTQQATGAFDAYMERFEGWYGQMEAGGVLGGLGGEEAGPEGQAPPVPPKVQLLLDQAQMAIESFKAEEQTAAQTQKALTQIGNAIYDIRFGEAERIAHAQTLGGLFAGAVASGDPFLGGDDANIQHIEGIIKSFEAGNLSGSVAVALARMGPSTASAVMQYAQGKAVETMERQGLLNVQRPGQASAPFGGGQPRLAAPGGPAPEAAPEAQEVVPESGGPPVTQEAPRSKAFQMGPKGRPPAAAVKTVTALVRAVERGDEAAANRLYDKAVGAGSSFEREQMESVVADVVKEGIEASDHGRRKESVERELRLKAKAIQGAATRREREQKQFGQETTPFEMPASDRRALFGDERPPLPESGPIPLGKPKGERKTLGGKGSKDKKTKRNAETPPEEENEAPASEGSQSKATKKKKKKAGPSKADLKKADHILKYPGTYPKDRVEWARGIMGKPKKKG